MKVDVLIVGAGPAGASCALWLARLGISSLVVDAKAQAGGLLTDSPYQNDWIVTQPGVTGTDLAEYIGLSLAAAGVPMILGARAEAVRQDGNRFHVTIDLHNGESRDVQASKLVIAAGVRPRSGGLEAGEHVILGPGREAASYHYEGKSVAILGGGDNAFENHAFVKRASAREAHIFARTVRASHVFREPVDGADVFAGPYRVSQPDMSVNGRPYDTILVMYGWEPVPVLDELGLARDERGYLKVDLRTCETSRPGVFAIGEIAATRHPSVVTAMGDGIAAAKAIQKQMERPV